MKSKSHRRFLTWKWVIKVHSYHILTKLRWLLIFYLIIYSFFVHKHKVTWTFLSYFLQKNKLKINTQGQVQEPKLRALVSPGWDHVIKRRKVKVKVAQSCPTLRSHAKSPYSPWNSLGPDTGVGSLCLLQGILPNEEEETKQRNRVTKQN